MNTTRIRTASLVTAALAAGLFSRSLRAEDAAPQPGALPKISNAFLESMVGSWKVVAKTQMGDVTGVSRVKKVAGGTALLQETEVEAGPTTHRSLGVLRVDDGGKTIRVWRFDTLGTSGDPREIKGALTADGFDAEGGEVKLHAKKNEGGFETTVERGGSKTTAQYTKADAEPQLSSPDAPKEGLRAAMIGTWDVVGEWIVPNKDGKPAPIPTKGTSSFRWALGGKAIVHDYQMTAGPENAEAVGIHRWPSGQVDSKVWFFGNDRVEPMVAEGPTTDTSWEGKGKMPGEGEIALHWAKKGEGFEMKFEMGGNPAGSEVYTRRK